MLALRVLALRTLALSAALLVAPRLAAAQGAPQIEWFAPGHITVQTVALSPDGTRLATASLEDETIKIWDTASGGLIRTIAGTYAGIWSVQFTPDGQYVAAGGGMAFGSGQSNVLLWRVSDGALIRQFVANSLEVHSVAISPDGQLLAAGDQNQNAWLWSISDGALLHTFTGHTGAVFGVAFSPD